MPTRRPPKATRFSLSTKAVLIKKVFLLTVIMKIITMAGREILLLERKKIKKSYIKAFCFFLFFLFLLSPQTTQAQAWQGFNSLPPTGSASVPGGGFAAPALAAPVQSQDDGSTDDPAGKKLFGFLDTSGLTNAIVGSFASLAGSFVSFILGILVHIMSFVATFVEAIFDKVLEITVLKMGELIRGGQVKGAIETAWTSIRDIANIGLVFVLLYISVKTILRASGHDTKKMLGSVIIAALFINFSFFIGALIVDTSNIMALEVYDQLTEGESSLANSFSENIGLEQMGQNFLDTIGGVTGAFTGGSNAAIEVAIKSVQAPLILIILLLAYIIILIIASGLLIARVVTIILLLILSPIAFAAQILPKTQKIAAEWWQSIIGQSFFIPVFLIFLLMVKDVVENGGLEFIFGEATTSGQSASIINATAAGLAQTVLPGLVVLGLLAAAIIAAQKITTMGSAAVGKISGSITTKIGGAAFGAGAVIGRNTVGLGAERLNRSSLMQDKLSNYRLGRAAMRGLDKVGKSSFDARGSKTFSGVASATGLTDYGTPAKDGFQGQQKRFADEKTNFAKNVLKEVGDDDKKVQEANEKLSYDKAGLEQAKLTGDKELIKAQEQQVADSKKAVQEEKNRRKISYAETLENRSKSKISKAVFGSPTGSGGSSSPSAVAGAKIMKELTKGGTDKQIDSLIETLKAGQKQSQRNWNAESKRDAEGNKS